MEEGDIVIRVGNSLWIRDEPIGGGRGCKPKKAYKEVPRPSRRLGLVTTKSSFILLKEANIYF